MGFDIDVIELGQNYSTEETLVPPVDVKSGKINRSHPLLPFNSVGWGDKSPYTDHTLAYPKYPPHVQQKLFLTDPDKIVTESSRGLFGTVSIITDPANSELRYPDSDIELFLQPKDESLEATLSLILTVVGVLDALRPIHVSINNVGWLSKDADTLNVSEPYVLFDTLFVPATETIRVSDSGLSVTTPDTAPVSDTTKTGDWVIIMRDVLWDITQDAWDLGSSWDTNVVSFGGH